MQQIIRTNKGNELTQRLETERIRLESSVHSEIAIVLKLANSPLVKRYLMNPDIPELEIVALEEIASYRSALTGYSIFWINDIDRIFYIDDNNPYWLDADDPVNYWYYMTLHDTEVYNFNINFNPDLNQIRLWINAPVFDDEGAPVGMVGTGIELSVFLDSIYQNIGERTELYFFIPDGKIYGARDIGLVIEGANIVDVLSASEIDILAVTRTLEPLEKQTFVVPNGVVAIGSIPLLDWYSIAFVTDSIADYYTAMSVLFLVVLVLILFIFVIFNIFISRFLKSLRKASESLAMVARMREQELIADNEMLDRLNRMKTEFFQNMSHDFKTPLTVISTSIINAYDLLDFEIDKEEMRKSLDNALSEIMRLARMVDSTMKYSSLQDNRQDMEPLDIAPVLRDGAETYRALLERNGNSLSLEIPRSLSLVHGNTDMLLHVLSNLLSNANRHTRGGAISIRAMEDGDAITVTVRDTGTGVKPELLPRVFERGVSEDGTGLGLSICKTAIDAHHGTISIESVYRRGAAVTFTIPIYKKPDPPENENE